MKLSQMQAMLEAIKAQATPENPDPDVRFWLNRNQAAAVPGELHANIFIDLEVDAGPDLTQHRISTGGDDVVQQAGDWTIPLTVVPFYKERA